jgi:hypothetical protein
VADSGQRVSNDGRSAVKTVEEQVVVAQTCIVISAEELVGDEWAEWYRLTPAQRWAETSRLWQTYLALGGSLDPEPDTQSPFFDARARGSVPADGRPGLRVIRRSVV